LKKTGIEKNFPDATAALRGYMRRTGFHDYDVQEQREAGRVTESAALIDDQGLIQRRVALYRPATKRGDPRLRNRPQTILEVVIQSFRWEKAPDRQ
jgi:hypothetical protein